MAKDLFLILKTQYFKEIQCGKKTSEYRELSDYWLKRLTSQDWRHVTFQLGYSKNAPRIRRRILAIECTTITHPFFGNKPKDVFEIKLGDEETEKRKRRAPFKIQT